MTTHHANAAGQCRKAGRICQLNLADQLSGAERIALTLHQRFCGEGRDARLCVGERRTAEPGVQHIDNDAYRTAWARQWGALGGNLADSGWDRLSKAARAVGRPNWAWQRLRGREDHDHPGTAAWIESIRRQPPDIIHAHNLHGGYFDLRHLPELCEIAPVVITMHDAWLLLDGAAYSELPRPPRRAAHNLEIKRAIFERCRLRVAAPCRWLLDQLPSSVIAGAVIESRCLPYGNDTDVFRPVHDVERRQCRDELGIDPESNVVLFVGKTARSNPAKDFSTVRDAVARAADEVPEQAWTLMVLGDSGRAESLGRAQVRYLGSLTDPVQIARVYAASDVLAHAAHADTFPVVVLEAMACGRPVVATQVGGIGEQICEGRTGRLVPPGDAAAMGRALAALARDPEQRDAMGRAARADAESRFGVGRMVRDYLNWFDEIASSNP